LVFPKNGLPARHPASFQTAAMRYLSASLRLHLPLLLPLWNGLQDTQVAKIMQQNAVPTAVSTHPLV
jgi:hypothetical protein